MTTRIFVPQPIPALAMERLSTLGEVTVFPHVDRRITDAELQTNVPDAEVLVALGGIRYDEPLLERVTRLRLVAAMHPAPRFVDIPAATRRRVPVTGIPNTGLARTTAEFTFALLMATAWRLPEADRFLRDGRWQQNQSEAFLGTRLYGKALGIVGLGAIGTQVAIRAQACGMQVSYAKRTGLSPAQEAALGIERRSIEDLFRESDFVVLTPAMTPSTIGMVDEDLLRSMKRSAILVNTSRGPVVDEEALERVLEEGAIRGAGLDVFEHERSPEDERFGPSKRLMARPNVVLTPHMGSASRETREEMAMRTVENITRFLDGQRPLDVLNPEVYGEPPRFDERVG